jgi:hypothetical protein
MDYSCSQCSAVVTREVARAAHYRCPNCQLGSLVVRSSTPGSIFAVPAATPKPETVAEPVEVERNQPRSLADELAAEMRVALTARRSFASSAAAIDDRSAEASAREAKSEPLLQTFDEKPSEPDDGSEAEIVAVVLPPLQNDKDATAMEQLAGTLARLPSSVALEIAGDHEQRRLLIRGAPQAVRRIAAQLYAVYRQVEVEILSAQRAEDPARAWQEAGGVTFAAELHLSGPEFLPLKTWKEFEGNDPLLALLGAFDLRPGEHALSQVILRSAAPEGWADEHLRQLANLKRRGYGVEVPMPARNILGGVGSLFLWVINAFLIGWALVGGHWQRWLIVVPVGVVLAVLSTLLFRLSNNPWAGTLDEEAVKKLGEKAFQVEIRLFTKAQTEARARDLLDHLIAVYQLFDTTSGNHLSAIELPPETQPSGLALIPEAKAFLLNVKEIACLWHMPVQESLELVRRGMYERLLPLTSDVTYPNGAFIGESCKGERQVDVYLPPEALKRNIFVVGETQMGKSSLTEHIAAQWMRDPDRSVLIIDPHGDLAQHVVGLVPPERAADVIYADLSDETQSVGMNLVDVSDGSSVDTVAEDFVDVGKALWEKYWGPRMVVPLGYGLRALAHANLRRPPERQYTIFALAPLLTCTSMVRNNFLNREVPDHECPGIHQYFMSQYAESSASHREQVVEPVLSKARAFERSAVIRRFVGQPRSTIRLFEAIRSRKIIILNCKASGIGRDLTGFIGSLFLNRTQQVIVRQNALPREERVQVSVIVSEFQTMLGVNYGELLGELLKSGGNFCLDTQSLDSVRQIDPEAKLLGKIFSGVATTVAFRVNADDAKYLVEGELDYQRLSPESPANLPARTAYIKTIRQDGSTIPVYSVHVADVPPQEKRVIELIRSRQPAYTVSGAEADRLAAMSQSLFMKEYERPLPEGERPKMGAQSEAGMRAMQGEDSRPESAQAAPTTNVSTAASVNSDSQRERQLEKLDRPKAPLPKLAAKNKTKPTDEETKLLEAIRLANAK